MSKSIHDSEIFLNSILTYRNSYICDLHCMYLSEENEMSVARSYFWKKNGKTVKVPG